MPGQAAFVPLSDYLRLDLSFCGTKVVCAEGDCGACTVLLGSLDSAEQISYVPVNSCIQFMYQLDGRHVISVEGLSTSGESPVDLSALNPVQEAMVTENGTQCGYCTPGFVMALCSLADTCKKQGVKPGACQVKDALTGNLCRCTGYEGIIEAGLKMDLSRFKALNELYPQSEIVPKLKAMLGEAVQVEDKGRVAFIPNSLASALRYLASHEKVSLVSGGTDLSVNINKRGLLPETILSTHRLGELEKVELLEGGPRAELKVGARVTLAHLESVFADLCPEFADILWVFGSPQIRHAGTMAGNIANGSPIADSLPFLFVMDADVEVAYHGGSRRIAMKDLYTGYKTMSLKKGEMISAVFIPLPQEGERLKLYKVSKRQHLDISAFTAAIKVKLNAQNKIEQCRVVFGGVAPTVVYVPEVEKALLGQPHELSTYEKAGQVAAGCIKPISDVRGSADFRSTLAENIFVKFFYESDKQRSRETVSCK